jgi:hypothetical protein
MRRFEPSANCSSCEECQSIARELNGAYAEAHSQERPAAKALYALIGGTEEDAKRADQLVLSYAYQPASVLPRLPNRLGEAIRRRRRHTARTGHKLQKVAK